MKLKIRYDEGARELSKRDEDAGYDIYPRDGIEYDGLTNSYKARVTEIGTGLVMEEKDGQISFKELRPRGILIPGHKIVMIPTGIHTEFDPGIVGLVWERGSTGSKGLAVRCGVIDSGFRGEWMIMVENHGDSIWWDKAIAQVIFQPAYKMDIEVGELGDSERGNGMLGSSGK